MLYEIITLSTLFYSFYNIYKFSAILSSIIFSLTILLHVGIISLYHEFFTKLHQNLEQERENIFLYSITKFISSKKHEQNNCEICYESFSQNEEICELKCHCKNKYYHEECILNWFRKNSSCPFCRKTFKF